MQIQKTTALKGSIDVPGDKSISHRSVMLGALANGCTRIENFLWGADCISTIDCFRNMGIKIENNDSILNITGRGLYGLKAPESVLNTGNSGTTTRILSGILCGQKFNSVINGDESLCSRPMNRILEPLGLMGADIKSQNNNGCAPLLIHGKTLNAIEYHTPVASAQVKSALLMAGLYAQGHTKISEHYLTRNHTELMLRRFGADLETTGTTVTISPNPQLTAQHIMIPGDISSAAYFIAAALIVPGSELLLRNVGINPTRDGILRIAIEMGADITLENVREAGGERTADILVRHTELKGVTIEGELIPTLIDEIPVIAVLACFANGTTIIRDAAELKVKESNRIDSMVKNLSAMKAHITGTEDGMIIEGGHPLHGAEIESFLDHRIAMSFAIAGLQAEGVTKIRNSSCVDISYPGFFQTLASLK